MHDVGTSVSSLANKVVFTSISILFPTSSFTPLCYCGVIVDDFHVS